MSPQDLELERTAGDADGERLVLARRAGEPLGRLRALRRRTWVAGREAGFLELVEAWRDPRLARAEAAALFATLRDALPDAAGDDPVCFAWPSDAAWRAHDAFEPFDVVRTQHLLVAPCDAAGPAPPEVEPLARFDEQARWLWDRCSGDWGASTVRDERFLNRRLVDHQRACDLLGVRDAEGILRGYAAVRAADWPAARGEVLVDWLVPPAEPEVAELLCRAVLAHARAAGLQRVTTCLVEWSPWFELFQRRGFAVHPSELFLVARASLRRFDNLWLRDRWWLTLADADLV